MDVLKASGEVAPFDTDKIRYALLRVKANPALIEQIIETVNRKIYNRIPTAELYRIVFDELKKSQTVAAAKYNLKHAIMQLGPTGYPFEKYIAALWQSEGFTTKTGQIVKGYCVSHEIDVIAEKENLHYLAECKFHSFQGKASDIKHALYVYARFLDVERQLKSHAQHADKIHMMWLVTNTRLTSDAIAYGACVGLGLLSWDFPADDGLRERIERSGLHPITCLISLPRKEKQQLLQRSIVLCRDLLNKPEILLEIGVGQNKMREALDEAGAICT